MTRSARGLMPPFRQNASPELTKHSPPRASPPQHSEIMVTLPSSGEIPLFLHPSCQWDSPSSGSPRFRGSTNLLKPSSSMVTFRSTNTFGVSGSSQSQLQVDTAGLTGDCVSEPSPGLPPLTPRTCSDPPAVPSLRSSRGSSYWSNRFSTIADFSHTSMLDPSTSTDSHSHLPAPPNHLRISPSVPHSVTSLDSAQLYAISSCDSVVIAPIKNHEPAAYPPHHTFDAFKFPSPPNSATDILSEMLSTAPHKSSAQPVRSLSPTPSTSTVASYDFAPVPTVRFRSPLLRHPFHPRSPSMQSDIASIQAACYSSPSDFSHPLVSADGPSLPASPITPQFSVHPYPSVPRSVSEGSDSGNSSSSFPSQSRSPLCKPRRRLADLPESLGWLRDICFELWIDQEGFRAIRPKFRLASYSPSPPPLRDAGGPSPSPSSASRSRSRQSDDPVDALTCGIAVFRPVKRVTSNYHHGTLDALPVIRRLTLADNEDKDYISRQARLAIKTNGVYAVSGTEPFDDHPFGPAAAAFSSFLHVGTESSAHGSTQQQQQQHQQQQPQPQRLLQWRFEYVVDDRRNDAGRVVPGEKTLTPLSFACSPGLLHPAHGKRIRLMHVLRKTLTPKLSSARLAAHTRPLGVVGVAALVEHAWEEDGPPGLKPAGLDDESAWPAPPTLVFSSPEDERCAAPPQEHRRTRSTEPKGTAQWSTEGSVLGSVQSRTRPVSVAAAYRRRAPASVIGKVGSQSATNAQTEAAGSACTDGVRRTDTVNSTSSHGLGSRHILSGDELATILASFPTPGGGAVGTTGSALSPPSYYRHRRVPSDVEAVDEMGVLQATT